MCAQSDIDFQNGYIFWAINIFLKRTPNPLSIIYAQVSTKLFSLDWQTHVVVFVSVSGCDPQTQKVSWKHFKRILIRAQVRQGFHFRFIVSGWVTILKTAGNIFVFANLHNVDNFLLLTVTFLCLFHTFNLFWDRFYVGTVWGEVFNLLLSLYFFCFHYFADTWGSVCYFFQTFCKYIFCSKF